MTNNIQSFAGIVDINGTTDSTSTSTGALQVAGGAGIASNLHVGGTGTFSGNVTVSSNLVVGTDTPSSLLTVNAIPEQRSVYDHSEAPLTVTYNAVPTTNTILNDPKSVLHLAREGTSGEAFGARATFKLSRYENNGLHSRTRLDLNLAHDSYDDVNVMTMKSNGDVDIPGSLKVGGTPVIQTVAVGTVTTGQPGTVASVGASTQGTTTTFSFTIPKGNPGNDGADGSDGVTPIIQVNPNTVTEAAGGDASVEASTDGAVTTFTFTIPKGDKGEQGDPATINASSSAGNNTIVQRDGSGNFAAGIITATGFSGGGSALSGLNASNVSTGLLSTALGGTGETSLSNVTVGAASQLETARTINGQSFNGTTNITISANTPNSLTAGTDLSGSSFNGGSAITFNVESASTNTANKIVKRDGSGNFTAGNITASTQLTLGTSASIRQSTSNWTGNPGSGVGKIEYHSNRWYIVAGSNSSELLRIRRDGTDKFAIDNDGKITMGIVPADKITGTVANATTAGGITNQANSATITASASADNSTIVQRTSDGHIFANYFNTTPNDVTSGVTKVCVETSNDGYIRHGTAAAIQTFIGLGNYALTSAIPDVSSFITSSDLPNLSGYALTSAIPDVSSFITINDISGKYDIPATYTQSTYETFINGSSSVGNNTIVKRDANGNFAAGIITATTFSASTQLTLGTSASIRQTSTPTSTGDPANGVGKIEYHSNRWYIAAAANSTELLRIRRGGDDQFVIDNDGKITMGIVPADKITGTVANATNAGTATTATNATNVNLTADNASVATRFITFADGQSGDQGLKTDSDLTYNPSTNILSATVANATNATNVNLVADDATNTTRYITFAGAATGGNQRLNTDTGLTYNPSTNTLSAGPITATSATINDYINHSGDSGTRFGFSANDTFIVDTASTRRLTIDSDGATTLSGTLSVSGNSTFSSNVAFDTDTLYVNAQGNNVGIGKTVPGTSYKLDVNGDINCTGVYVDGIELTGSGGALEGDPTFTTVDINGTSATASLDVETTNGTETISTTTSIANILHKSTGFGRYGFFMGVKQSNGYGWIQVARTTNADTFNLLLNPLGGNVGIGTDNPSAKLDSRSGITSSSTNWISGVFGGTQTTSPRVVLGNLEGYATVGGHSSALNAWENLYLNDPVNDVVITGSGNVGIGQNNPGVKLHINGKSIIEDVLVLRGQRDNYDGNDRSSYWDYDGNVALALEPAADDGATAILFKSIGNSPSDFAYIAYDEDYPEAGVSAGERGALILSSQNDGTGSSDHIRVKGRLVVEAVTSSSNPTNAFQVKSSNVTDDILTVARSGRMSLNKTVDVFTGLKGADTDSGRAQFVLTSAYSDLVIASSLANDVHGSTLTFATRNPSNAAEYRKFVIGQPNWGNTLGSKLNFGWTNSSQSNPHNAITGTTTAMTIDGLNKRLGLSTNSPETIFHTNLKPPANSVWYELWKHTFDSVWGFNLCIRHRPGVDVSFMFRNRANGGNNDVMTFLYNRVGINNTVPGHSLDVSGVIRATGNIIAFSDGRYKTDVRRIEDALEKVGRVSGYTFRMKDGTERCAGVIAQEIREVLPEVVVGSEESGYNVAYGNMAGLFIEAIKELKYKNSILEARLSALEKSSM